MSDFHATVAAIHEGRCPLCEGPLVVDGFCTACDCSWRIQGVHERTEDGETVIGMGPMIVASRKLTDDERRRLYNRGG